MPDGCAQWKEPCYVVCHCCTSGIESEAAKWGSVSREWSPSVIDATKKHNGPQIAFMRQQRKSAKKTAPQDRP